MYIHCPVRHSLQLNFQASCMRYIYVWFNVLTLIMKSTASQINRRTCKSQGLQSIILVVYSLRTSPSLNPFEVICLNLYKTFTIKLFYYTEQNMHKYYYCDLIVIKCKIPNTGTKTAYRVNFRYIF